MIRVDLNLIPHGIEARRAGLGSFKNGKGDFDYTPKCGSATFRALANRGWIEPAPDHLQRYRRTSYTIGKAGAEALLRWSALLNGFKPKRFGERSKRPRRPGEVEIRRRGGREAAARALAHHRRCEAEHKRIADHLEASLAQWDGSVSAQQEAWRSRGRARK